MKDEEAVIETCYIDIIKTDLYDFLHRHDGQEVVTCRCTES
jgi:hypothetical protein